MRKLISLGLLAVILLSLTLTGYAEQPPIKMEDVSVEAGQTVYLDIYLTKPVTANAIGIEFSCDESVLKPMPSSSTWKYDGVLEDFDPLRNVGVWASASLMELQGEILTLAFNVVTDKAYFETEVSCTVIMKNDSEKVLEYTAQAVVRAICDHAYGAWIDDGTAGHSQVCQSCGVRQTQDHFWDEGESADDPAHPEVEVTVYTCKVCKATKTSQKPTGEQPTVPPETQPDVEETTPESEPGAQETMPDEIPDEGPATGEDQEEEGSGDDNPNGTVPGEDTNHEEHQPTVPTIGDDGDHDHAPSTFPTVDSNHDHEHDHVTLPTTDTHDHDHADTPTVSNTEKTRNAWIFFGLVGVMIVVAVIFVKKKR